MPTHPAILKRIEEKYPEFYDDDEYRRFDRLTMHMSPADAADYRAMIQHLESI